MTQRIDRKTFEVDVDYSLLNDRNDAEIDNIKADLHKSRDREQTGDWWAKRWAPLPLLALPLLILCLMIFGFWHILDKIDATQIQALDSTNMSQETLIKHVTKEHDITRSLLKSIATMIAEIDVIPPMAEGSSSVEPSGPDWKKEYDALDKQYQNIKAELDIANGKIDGIAGLPRSVQATIKRSVVVFNSRMIDGRDVVTGWNFDSVTAIKPSSEFCYLQVLSGQENISVRFDIMRNRQKVDLPNSDMKKHQVSQTQLDRARSACIWHTGKGA